MVPCILLTESSNVTGTFSTRHHVHSPVSGRRTKPISSHGWWLKQRAPRDALEPQPSPSKTTPPRLHFHDSSGGDVLCTPVLLRHKPIHNAAPAELFRSQKEPWIECLCTQGRGLDHHHTAAAVRHKLRATLSARPILKHSPQPTID